METDTTLVIFILAIAVGFAMFVAYRVSVANRKAEREYEERMAAYRARRDAEFARWKNSTRIQTQKVPKGSVGIQSGGNINVTTPAGTDLSDLTTMMLVNAATSSNHNSIRFSDSITATDDDSPSKSSSWSSSESYSSSSDSGPSSDW